MNETPMDEGTLEGIRERVAHTYALWKEGDDVVDIGKDPGIVAAMDRHDLLAEVDRLRSANATAAADALSEAALQLMKTPAKTSDQIDSYWHVAQWLEYRAAAMKVNAHLAETKAKTSDVG
jgi:hypothetical protein